MSFSDESAEQENSVDKLDALLGGVEVETEVAEPEETLDLSEEAPQAELAGDEAPLGGEDVQSTIDDLTARLDDEDLAKKAYSEAETTIKELATFGNPVGASKVMAVLACFETEGAAAKSHYLKKLNDLFETDSTQKIYIKNSGFTTPSRRIKAKDCFARLEVLRALEPGVMCYDKTWGFGVVKQVLLVEEKVEIDFNEKPGHLLALSYAAETLSIVDEDHLFAQRHLKREEFDEMVKKNPAEIIKIALKSFGPKPIQILQEILIPSVVEEAGWKKFWDKARKHLKEDPLVTIPSKRSEPLDILDKEQEFDSTWFENLKKNTDMESIITNVGEVFSKFGDKIEEEFKPVLSNRLAFVAKGAEGKLHGLMVKSLLAAQEFGFSADNIGASDFVEKLMDKKQFLNVLQVLPSKDIKGFLKYILEVKQDEAEALYLSSLDELEYTGLQEVISLICNSGRENSVAESIRSDWNKWNLSVAGLYWLNMNAEKMDEWKLGKTTELIARNLAELQKDYMGEKLRIRNQIRELFNNPEWLGSMMDDMNNRQRLVITQGIKDSTAWQKLDQASVLGKIVKLYPETQELVSDRANADVTGGHGFVTSERTYKERQEALRKLKQEEIPQNSKDIAVAREYGDLRENFEFKAAKDQQRILLAREGEYEQMLSTVQPTNFENFGTEAAGIATSVNLKFDDGREENFTILGEWDNNEELNVISCSSRLAKMLKGKTAGSRVIVPSEEGDVECVLVSISGIPDKVNAWLNEA